MKSAILAIIFPLAAAAAALTPSTIKDDIPGTATIDEIVTAGGSARPADVRRIVDASFNGGTQEVNRVTGAFDGTVGRLDAVKRDRTDLKVYRKVKDCWTWTNWSNPQEPDAKEAPADFIALANSPGSEPIHFERGAWWGAVQFWPNGKVKYSQSEIPPGGTGELSTSVNFAMYAYDETGTNEIYRFGTTATRTDPTNETVVAWDGTRNQYVRVATTDMVDDSIRREVTQATNAIRRVDGTARTLPKYLWRYECADSYEKDAYWYYDREDATFGFVPGLCSARRVGGILERNYDWYRDESAEFVVLMQAGPGRYASAGIANIGENLTDDFVTSGAPSRYYKCLPGRTVDGVNSEGVAIEVNVVVTNGSPWETHVEGDGRDIDSRWAVRFVLDNAASAGWAASNLARRVYLAKAMKARGYSVHYAIVDRHSTWLVEDGKAIERPASWPLVMTNFRLDTTPGRILENDPYGAGYERYFMLTNGAVSVTNAWYSNAYRRTAGGDFPWPTEFAGSVDAEGPIPNCETDRLQAWAKANIPAAVPDSAFPRGAGLWQTVHCSVYDITNLTLRVSVQEEDDWYVFQIPNDGLVRSVNGKAGDVNLTAEDVGAVAKDDKIVVIGFEAEATPTSTWSVVVGPGAVASNKCSVALGINATASHAHSVSLGQSATSSGIGGISIGTGSRADSQMPTVALPAIAIGYTAHADSGHAMAIGSSASATNLSATALGERANANGYCSTAVGANAMTKGDHAVAIGISKATNNYAVAIGHGAASHGERTFNVNPEGGASGFYIGSLTLADLFGQKVDKVTTAANGHLARFGTGGALADSGYSITDLVPYAGEYQNVRKAALQSRAIDDFGVYAPTDFSDFTWDGYRTDALEAIGNTQPYFIGWGYDDGEWECDFYMDGHWYYGYYYGTSNDRTIEMDFHAEWYDDEEPWEWHDDYLTLVATREPTGWDFDNPIDIIVKNSDLSGIRSDISVLDTRIDSLEGAIGGETKVMRTGKEGEHGVGYGYVSTDPKTGNRKWRLRVPNFSSRSGLSTNATGYTNYRPLNYSGGYAYSYAYYQATYPLSFANMWSVKMDVIRTSEPYGSDAVNAADYRFSFITTATNLPAARHILSFDVKQVSTSPRIFHVTPVTNDLIRTVREYWTDPTKTTASDSKSSEVLYYADVPPGMGGTGLFYTSGSTQYRETFTVSAVYVRNATLVSTNSFTLPFLVRLGSDTVTYSSYTRSANDKFVEQKAVVNVASGATFMNVTVPYYKQVTTLNSGLFYDEKRKCTFRMTFIDGHPVTEIYSETDWRED